MKKIIVYFPFPLREPRSGSSVRPIKVLEAFREFGEEQGIQIIAINGESKIRKKQLRRLYENTNPKEILFCYMENSTLPIWLTDYDHKPRSPFLEWAFFRYLRQNSIPLGLFYRDIYWKFNDEYNIKGLKRAIMKFIYACELRLYKRYVTQFFLPSKQMNQYTKFDPKRVHALPPGGMNCLPLANKDNHEEGRKLNVIYVGGISPRYGLDILLEAFKLLNKKNDVARLMMVCREDEYYKYYTKIRPYEKFSWLEVYHAYGEKLLSIYEQADIAIIPRHKTLYNDFAVPVKLFEYLSFGLPVVVTDCAAQAEIVENDKLGVVTRDDSVSISQGIAFFLDFETRMQYENNVQDALINHHLWIHRVKKVYKILMQAKNNNIKELIN